MSDINYALVEQTRPPIYTAMKYWGKKPHNIWNAYIANYVPENGLFLDPFSGSCTSILEAFKAGKKAISFDLNPLSSFILECLTSKFDEPAFKKIVSDIVETTSDDKIYKKYFTTKSRTTGQNSVLQHAKWAGGKIFKIGVSDFNDDGSLKRPYMAEPNDEDFALADDFKNIKIPYAYPDKPFHIEAAVSASFLNAIGGNNISNLWTRRNVYVLSKIFDQILKVTDQDLRKQLQFGFIQTLHLCTKMNVPRNEAANRDFSTSWGRSAYLCADRQMEMNPLLVFKGSCLGRQSVQSALKVAKSYLGKLPKLHKVSSSNKDKSKLTGFDIKYGVVDALTLSDYIPPESVDFVMTDPPYGGLVQYLDLSTIWLSWLQLDDPAYAPDYNAEITIKPGLIAPSIYKQKFTTALKEVFKVLKADGKVVFTFHNKDLAIWNAFLHSISHAGFKIEKVIHQQNRRSGEANVANPYGTSGSDFYIRCIKGATALKNDEDEFRHFVTQTAISIIANRSEPTPYEFLLSGLLAEVSGAGYDLENFDEHIKDILASSVDTIFKITANDTTKAGNLWWFVKPSEYIRYPDRMLSERVDHSILSLLLRKSTVTLDEVLAEIFIKYPNGLTPDIRSIDSILAKYAVKSQERWAIKNDVKQEHTKHTEYLMHLAKLGKKLGYKIYVGKREQPEKINGQSLSDFADVHVLDFLKADKTAIKRIEMIDMIWLDPNNDIACAIEVENSTNFTSGIQRASNIDAAVKKIMIMPDYRANEFKRISDPLFLSGFKDNSWRYAFYSDVTKLIGLQKPKWADLDSFSKAL